MKDTHLCREFFRFPALGYLPYKTLDETTRRATRSPILTLVPIPPEVGVW